MLYNNVGLLHIGEGPVDGYCYYSNVPFGGYTSINEYQLKVLEVLDTFDAICKKHNIKYFLSSGTLLGAVRHKGFIPWDDDVDVVIERTEYEKLKKVCEQENIAPYVLVDAFKSKDYTYTYARFRKSDTTYILRGEVANNYCSGIYIDIFCYDYLSDNKVLAAIQERAFRNYHRLVSFGYSQHIYHVTYFEEYFYLILSKIVGKRNVMKFLQKIMASGKKDKSSRVMIDLLLPAVNFMNVLDKEYYQQQEWVEFEGRKLPIPYKATKMLNEIYAQSKIKRNCHIADHIEEDIEKPIQQRIYFEEYQFIPLTRSNPRHSRVAFDLTRASEYYTEYYKDFFDRKKNNRNAVKERRYRERAAKYAVEMGEVSTDVFLAVQELKTKEFFANNREKIAENIFNEQYTWFNEKMFFFDVVWQKNIDKENLNYIYETMLLSGEFEYSLRLKKKREFLYPEESNDELDIFLKKQMRAWYAMYDGEFEKAESILKTTGVRWEKALIHEILKMMMMMDKEDYESCKLIANKLIEKNKNLFIALYCKGICLYKTEKKNEAKKCFEEAANTTLFMPFIQKALDYIKLLEEE